MQSASPDRWPRALDGNAHRALTVGMLMRVRPSPALLRIISLSEHLAQLWAVTHREYEVAPDGLVFVTVDATLYSATDIQKGDVEVWLNYGTYRLGFTDMTYHHVDGEPLRITTRFRVPKDLRPEYVEVELYGELYRFPVEP